MNTLVQFRSPLKDLAVLQNRLNSIFSDFASPNGEPQKETLSAGNFIHLSIFMRMRSASS